MPVRGGFYNAPDIVACFDEAPGGGDIRDINAPRNAPAKSPAEHLERLSWHNALYQYEVALEATVTITHAALASKTVRIGAEGWIIGGTGTVGVYADIVGDIRVADLLLTSHGLGEGAIAMVALNGRMLPSGLIVQTSGEGLRQVAPWISGSGVYLRETAVSGSAALPAVSLTYSVMVFRHRSPDPSKPLFAGGPNAMQLGRGVIDRSKKYAKQVAVGEAPFAVNLDPTIDCAGGRFRSATGGVVVDEPGYSGALPTPAFRNIGL